MQDARRGGDNRCTALDEHLGGVRTIGENVRVIQEVIAEDEKAAQRYSRESMPIGNRRKLEPMERGLFETIRKSEDGEAKRQDDQSKDEAKSPAHAERHNRSVSKSVSEARDDMERAAAAAPPWKTTSSARQKLQGDATSQLFA